MTDSRLLTLDAFRAAQARIRGVAVHTPLVRLPLPDPDAEVYIKAEGLQPIGSFKLRGAYNKIAQLTPEERSRGVITYSSGNHAQGVAYAARVVGAKAVIVMPSNAPEIKKRATAALGAEIVEVGAASADRKKKAEELSAEFGYVMIPPYDDLQIIAGQGTCGLEIVEDLPDVDLVLSPVSGGGLLSGTAAAIKHLKPEVRVIGVEPELAADAQESFRGGRLVSWPAEMTTRTICDGLRTQSLGELNFEHIRAYVDDIITVSEAEVRAAMRTLLHDARLTPEPSGAAAAAAILFHRTELLPFQRVAVIMSGGNVEPELLKEVLAETESPVSRRV
ncbi:threonine ammonia-lyase [Paracidobacterium acidisoli]|uniref:Threonine/serine dehydratase n=1 Tax=Paracidobacterium acidisoli TaxID=2303751 RepID=A0A372IQQ9_9BACT|nr:threonine/serine dehydratase [Paracidobacterium acidisoli]MBT9331435.1 threonine/serine dehydratase [Paracidobacterium acidisoli]